MTEPDRDRRCLQASPRVLSWIATMAEALTLPLLLVAEDGTLLSANMAGLGSLRRGQWLQQHGAVVGTAEAARHDDWRRTLRRAAFERRRLEWPLPAGGAMVIAPVLGERGVPLLMLVLPAEAPIADACRLFAGQYALSAAELDVLLALCQGHSPRHIAARRGVRPATVLAQLAQVRRKCGEDRLETLLPRLHGAPPVLLPASRGASRRGGGN